ncbi:MAG: prenyltransferase [Halobacteriales archaeon]
MTLTRWSLGGRTGRLWRLLVRSRPRFWLYTAGPVLVGVAYGAASTAELVTPLSVALFAYFLLPANVFLYGVNDVFDADADTVNPKKGGDHADGGGSTDATDTDATASGGDASTARELRYGGDTREAAAVAVAGLLGVVLLFVVPPRAAPWIAGFLVLGTAYSAPPLRLKTTPLFDSVSNGLYVLPGVAAYVALAGQVPPLPALVGAWLWTMAMHTFSAIPDIEPDREAGLLTTATVLGERRTLLYVGAVWTLAAAAFGLLDPRAGALLAVYPLLVAAIAAADVDVARAYWWYPAVNTVVGMVLTLFGLWGLVHG